MTKLDNINSKILSCTNCPLSEKRTKAVPGEGSVDADVMFIGEGPGANEDREGRPFCGAAGNLLDELLADIKLKRSSVYITNVVKCRPPGNRDPLPDEVKTCWAYLEQQIKIIKPKLFVLLGRHAMDRFIQGKQISKAHGVLLRKELRGSSNKPYFRHYFPIYHPAAALYNGNLKDIIQKDFRKIPRILEKIVEFEGEKRQDDLRQEQMI